jgi:hypothetical protein
LIRSKRIWLKYHPDGALAKLGKTHFEELVAGMQSDKIGGSGGSNDDTNESTGSNGSNGSTGSKAVTSKAELENVDE